MPGGEIRAKIILDTSELDKLMGISGGGGGQGVPDSPNDPSSTKGLLSGIGKSMDDLVRLSKQSLNFEKAGKLADLVDSPLVIGSIAAGGLAAGLGALSTGIGGKLAEQFGAAGEASAAPTLGLSDIQVSEQGLTEGRKSITQDTGEISENIEEAVQESESFKQFLQDLNTNVSDLPDKGLTLTNLMDSAADAWRKYIDKINKARAAIRVKERGIATVEDLSGDTAAENLGLVDVFAPQNVGPGLNIIGPGSENP